MKFKLVFIFISVFIINVNGYIDLVYNRTNVFDPKIYEDILDREECFKQIRYIATRNAFLGVQFLDAGFRIPRSIQKGNLFDLGSYYECLGIHNDVQNTSMSIEGKFCMTKIPLQQDTDVNATSLRVRPEFSELSWLVSWFNSQLLNVDSTTYEDLISHIRVKSQIQKLVGITPDNMQRNDQTAITELSIQMAVCIPKPCSLQNALDAILDLRPTDLQIEEAYCRIPNDRPWIAADYVALGIFTFLGILMVLSTAYDIRHQIFLKKDPKTANKIYQSFSVYTNTLRLVTYKPVAGALECLDGIRAFAMIWVIIGHTYVNQLTAATLHNPLDIKTFIESFWSLWITAGPITVDTFFALSGLLLIYSTAGKMTGLKLVKNLHLFYLNRYLRLFPVLAACVLLQASLFHRASDGPVWDEVGRQTHHCRKYWWSTLLFMQNYYNPGYMCLPHSWYLAIDFQLFLISPLILFWVVSGKKKTAWITIISALLASLVGTTIYNFIMGFKGGPVTLSPVKEGQPDYFSYYYVNTLPRSPPFFVGMIFGYILHLCRGKKVVMSKVQVILLWFIAIILSSAALCTNYLVLQEDWDNQTVDDLINSYMRPIWALSICWIIFACTHGYGGPINWILSHPMWKILGRLSYAMYLFHYPIIILINASSISPMYFSNEFSIRRFMTDFTISVLAAYFVTLFVDAPSSVLIKHFIGGGGGKRRPEPVKPLNSTNGPTSSSKGNVEAPEEEVVNKTSL
ncbi:O-acyltransferase like protein-like [Galleria mellonella]|uniref:O-acyltransferase like protein-like n=1 Tax=Galleria mellonella TaxID=7137 RepID=A0ABM3MXL1_GALME|nr:O-acyltransferase like protein-like [Galleria mellonella]